MSSEKKKKGNRKREDSTSSSDDSSSSEDALPHDAPKISKSDYYNKSGEFNYWLRKKRKIYFDELSSKEAKQHFKAFVRRWNSGRLGNNYYDGSVVNQSNSSERTKYHWKFSVKLDGLEMGILRDSVVTMTNKKKREKPKKEEPVHSSSSKKKIIGPMRPPQSVYEREVSTEDKRREKKRKDKQYKEHKKMVIDELLPKATGREAKIEKRIAASQDRKPREHSPELADSHLMGGSESIQSIVEKRKHRVEASRSKKAEKAREKIAAYEEREKAKMDELLQLAKEAKSQSLW